MTLNKTLERLHGGGRSPIKQRCRLFRATRSAIPYILGALLCLAGLGNSAALAAELVEPGKSLVIVTTPQEIANPTAKLGTLAVVEDPDGSKRSLIYVAPSDILVFKDTVTYQVGTEKQTVEIDGRTGAQPFGSTELYETSFKAIFVLFILAVLVESGLQLIFRWRPGAPSVSEQCVRQQAKRST